MKLHTAALTRKLERMHQTMRQLASLEQTRLSQLEASLTSHMASPEPTSAWLRRRDELTDLAKQACLLYGKALDARNALKQLVQGGQIEL